MATMACAAQAATAPFWEIEGARLAAGKTHFIYGKAATSFALSTPELGVKIECTSMLLENGVLLGSNEGQPGKDEEVAVYSECTITGNGSPCSVQEPIKTNPLASELVETSVSGKKILAEEFKPVSGVSFTTLHFSGAGCNVSETSLTGSVAGEVVTNPGEERLELGKTPTESAAWLIKFPSTPITSILLVNTKGTVETVKTSLTAFGGASIESGQTLIGLANSECVPEQKKWNPAP